MKIAYLDCSSGVSGNMLIGCLVDYGLSFDLLLEELKKLPVSSFSITKRKKQFKDTRGTKITVQTDTRLSPPDMLSIIKDSNLSNEIKAKVNKVLNRIFEGEIAIHCEKNLHLHELGSLDTIIDVVSSISGLQALGIERLTTSYINLGKPSSLTLHLLSSFGIKSTRDDYELTTPTGAALVSTFADGYGYIPEMELCGVGIGFGSYNLETGDFLRMIVGEKTGLDEAILIETNIDDMNPKAFEYLIERLLDEGALDVWLTNIQMKKTRPAIKLSLIIKKKDEQRIVDTIFSETTTIGIRKIPIERMVLKREGCKIKTRYGDLLGKRITFKGKERLVPEYEELKKIAKQKRLPLIELLNEGR